MGLRRPGVIDAYLMGEVLPMFAGGMAVVVVLLILGLLVDQAAPIIAKGVNPLLVGKYLAFRLPEAFSRGMPIALLFAVLLALSRLAQDSELKAAVLHGVSPTRLAVPVLLAGGLVAVLSFINEEAFVPRGYVQSQRVMKDIILSNPRVLVSPGTFFNDGQGQAIYVQRVLPGAKLEGVTVIQTSPAQVPRRLTVAPRGEIVEGEGAIRLHDGTQTTYRNNNPRPASVFKFQVATIPVRELQEGADPSSQPTYLPIGQLHARIDELHRQGSPAYAEETALHRKFAEPAAAIAFALFGVAMSLFSLRSSTNLGLVGVMLLTFLYYATYTVFGVMGDSGALWAPLAAWAPDALYALGGIGLLLAARRG